MGTNTLPAPPRPGTTSRTDPRARWAAVVTICAAVLWVALMNQWFLAQELFGHTPRAASPLRLGIDAVGFEADVLPYNPTGDQLAEASLVPPQTYSGYWLTPYGMPGAGSENTTYIAGHSYDRIDLPFNKLSDPALVGKRLEVETVDGTLDYVVDSVTTYEKDTLKDSEIWRVVPHRIVLISCYTSDAVGKNVVVTASPAPEA
ncbi:class F sortase [Kocuria oceani]|uniref:Class F sortase n=1 Tax=Kocuria oceani TaxID=988827 RepID=A0ABV9TMS9_9MICC|nr:class F sortase [Kocuria oceani]